MGFGYNLIGARKLITLIFPPEQLFAQGGEKIFVGQLYQVQPETSTFHHQFLRIADGFVARVEAGEVLFVASAKL